VMKKLSLDPPRWLLRTRMVRKIRNPPQCKFDRLMLAA
jgi:hypothetical protein